MPNNSFLTTPAHANQPLSTIGSWQAATHVWDARELDALALARASGRPLLVRGEPGTGKSQIARAAAALLGWHFAYEVITARHEAQDLLWHYDAVERLAVANKAERTHMRDFVLPGVLWQALNPAGALVQQRHAYRVARANEQDATEIATDPNLKGTVVLLDEIDKADSDLPNSLLEVMANGGFNLPWGEGLHGDGGKPAPTLIILTSNEERELPAAFVRRCVCLHLVPPGDGERDAFLSWLQVRAKAHFPKLDEGILQSAAVMVLQDRLQSNPGLGARPGLAEYLDLLRALQEIAPDNVEQQRAWLHRLSPYVLQKQYPASQQRGLDYPDPRQAN